jgi:hypothetical protein
MAQWGQSLLKRQQKVWCSLYIQYIRDPCYKVKFINLKFSDQLFKPLAEKIYKKSSRILGNFLFRKVWLLYLTEENGSHWSSNKKQRRGYHAARRKLQFFIERSGI